MSEHRIFVKRIALVGIARFITGFRGLILLPILAKTLGSVGYGIWAQISVTVGLLVPFIMLNLNSSVVRFLPSEKDNKKIARGVFTVIFTVLLISIFFALVLFLFSNIFASIFLKDSSTSIFIKLASVLLILESLSQICLDPFRIFGNIRKYSVLTILQTILEVTLVAMAVFLGFALQGAIVALLITRVIILIFSLHFIVLHIGFAWPDFKLLKPYLAFSLPLLPIGIFDILINSSDRYVVGIFQGVSIVGIYSATYSIGFLATVFIFPIAYILSPTIFKFFDEGNLEKVKMYLSYSLKYFLLLAIPSIFGLTILAKTLLKTFATSDFVSFSSMFVVFWVAISAIFYGVQTIYGQIIMLKKNTGFFIIAFGLGFVVNLILNIIFVPYFGTLAAAVTTFLAYLVVAIIIYFKSTQYMKFKVDFIFIVKSILASVLMALFVYFANPVGFVKILLTIIGAAVVYFIFMLIMGAFNKEETSVLTSVFKKSNLLEKY